MQELVLPLLALRLSAHGIQAQIIDNLSDLHGQRYSIAIGTDRDLEAEDATDGVERWGEEMLLVDDFGLGDVDGGLELGGGVGGED